MQSNKVHTHQGLWLACDTKRHTHHCAWLCCSHVSVQVQAKLAQERKAAQAQWERELRAEARRQKRLRGEVCDSDDDEDDTREPEAEATQPGTVLQQTCAMAILLVLHLTLMCACHLASSPHTAARASSGGAASPEGVLNGSRLPQNTQSAGAGTGKAAKPKRSRRRRRRRSFFYRLLCAGPAPAPKSQRPVARI